MSAPFERQLLTSAWIWIFSFEKNHSFICYECQILSSHLSLRDLVSTGWGSDCFCNSDFASFDELEEGVFFNTCLPFCLQFRRGFLPKGDAGGVGEGAVEGFAPSTLTLIGFGGLGGCFGVEPPAFLRAEGEPLPADDRAFVRAGMFPPQLFPPCLCTPTCHEIFLVEISRVIIIQCI